MATSSISVVSFEQYLALEEKAIYKSEYYRGEILAMSGVTRRHSLIQINLSCFSALAV